MGGVVKKRTNDILLSISIISKDGSRDSIYLSNFASVNVVEEIKRIPGVGEAGIFGARDYAMRIWLQPDKMARLGVTPTDVTLAIRLVNKQYSGRRLGRGPIGGGEKLEKRESL